MLKKQYRLVSNYEFNKTRRLGKTLSGTYSRLFYLPTKEPVTRIGVVVSNKFDKSAVVRNRVKRVFREILRLEFGNIKPGFWIVVHPRKSCLEKKYEEISTDLASLLQKASLTG